MNSLKKVLAHNLSKKPRVFYEEKKRKKNKIKNRKVMQKWKICKLMIVKLMMVNQARTVGEAHGAA